jgi:hypothetical protein
MPDGPKTAYRVQRARKVSGTAALTWRPSQRQIKKDHRWIKVSKKQGHCSCGWHSFRDTFNPPGPVVFGVWEQHLEAMLQAS